MDYTEQVSVTENEYIKLIKEILTTNGPIPGYLRQQLGNPNDKVNLFIYPSRKFAYLVLQHLTSPYKKLQRSGISLLLKGKENAIENHEWLLWRLPTFSDLKKGIKPIPLEFKDNIAECDYCHQPFLVYRISRKIRHKNKYCCPKCKTKANSSRRRITKGINEILQLDDSNFHIKTCEYCGKGLTQLRSTKRFCNDICRVNYHRIKVMEDKSGNIH